MWRMATGLDNTALIYNIHPSKCFRLDTILSEWCSYFWKNKQTSDAIPKTTTKTKTTRANFFTRKWRIDWHQTGDDDDDDEDFLVSLFSLYLHIHFQPLTSSNNPSHQSLIDSCKYNLIIWPHIIPTFACSYNTNNTDWLLSRLTTNCCFSTRCIASFLSVWFPLFVTMFECLLKKTVPCDKNRNIDKYLKFEISSLNLTFNFQQSFRYNW